MDARNKLKYLLNKNVINIIKTQIMKKILLIILAISLNFNSFSQVKKAEWHTDMNKAIELSMKENKPILLFFTGSDWCGWCIKLVKEVYNKDEFNTWANKNVILVDIDFPRKKKLSEELQNQNRQLQQMFGVRGYPTVWFVKPVKSQDGQINLEKIGKTGYVRGGPNAWIGSANQILLNLPKTR